jgi:uncharacterized membrane protein
VDWKRWFRHVIATRATLRGAFPPAVLSRIEAAIAESERRHTGEIRVAIEASLDPVHVRHGRSPRERALQVFSELAVWDTEGNNGVLVYVLLADRGVEIVADRGYNGRVPAAEWAAVCRAMESSFSAGRFEQGALEGIARVSDLVAVHFPAGPGSRNPDELPNRPVIL